MPEYRNILVPVSDPESALRPLDAALRLAPRFAGHVTALHVRPLPATTVPRIGEGVSHAMAEHIVAIGARREAERSAAIRAVFDEVATRHNVPVLDNPGVGPSACWLEEAGREEDRLTFHGRLSDIIVMNRPESHDDESTLLAFNSALMASGKPLLLVPPKHGEVIGTSITIAWNGSLESTRAVAGAMPLLQQAGSVQIVSATHENVAGVADAESLAGALSWHGIRCSCRVIDVSPAHAGAAILQAAVASDADLLVMGAYTHSRLRQLILGGVTSHVIHHATLPCLLSH